MHKIDELHKLTASTPTLLICSGKGYEKSFREFINKNSIKNSTAKSYQNTCSEFLDFCLYCLGVQSVPDLEFEHIQEYLTRNRPLDDGTYRRSEFFIIRALLEKFKDVGLISILPLPEHLNTFGATRKFESRSVRQRHEKQEHHRIYDQFERVISTAAPIGIKELRDSTLITLLTLMNLPIGKLLNIKYGDLRQSEAGEVFLKVGEDDIYELSNRIIETLKKYLRETQPTSHSEYIFQSLTRSHRLSGKNLTSRDASRIIRGFCEEQGITPVTPRQLTKATLFILKKDALGMFGNLYS